MVGLGPSGNTSKRFLSSYKMFVVQIYMTCFQGIGIVDLTQMFDLYLMVGFTCLKDYYKVLEVDYDATDEKIRINYRRLALVGHLSFLVAP